MGYRVEYQPMKKVRGLEKRVSRKAALTALCMLLFFLVVELIWEDGSFILRKLIFPGDPAVTAAAFSELKSQLQSGTEVSASLKAFCMQILEGAKVASG